MKIPWWLYLIAAVAVCGLAIWAVSRFGLIGTLLIPVAAAGAVVNETAKAAGAKPIPKNDTGRPIRAGPSATSPTPPEGEKRARSRRNKRNYR